MKIFFLFLNFVALSTFAHTKAENEKVRLKIKENLSIFMDCYNEGLKADSKLGGKVVLSWDVDETGSVKNAETKKSTLSHVAVESCLVGKLKGLSFPPAPTGKVINISYPFVFSPKN